MLWYPNYHLFSFPTLTLLSFYLSFSYPLTITFFLSHTDPPAILTFSLWSPNYHHFPFAHWPSCHPTFQSLIPKLPPFSFPTLTLLPSYLSFSDLLTTTFSHSYTDPPAILPFIILPPTNTFFLSHIDSPFILPFSLWSPNYHLFPFPHWPSYHPTFQSLIPKLPPFSFPTLTLLPSYLSFSYPQITNYFLSHTDPPAFLPFTHWSPNYHLFPFPQWLLPYYLSLSYPLLPPFSFPTLNLLHPTFQSLIPKLPSFSFPTVTLLPSYLSCCDPLTTNFFLSLTGPPAIQWWANLDQAPKDLDKTIFRDLSPTPKP